MALPTHALRRLNFGESLAFLVRARISFWVDLFLVAGLIGLGVGFISVEREWTAPATFNVEIDLSPWALPKYTFFSLTRGLVAYTLSLAFTLIYGYWAAKDKRAERILVPLLDILQSIPVLGFLPGLVLGLVALFPHSNFGLELAAVLMIFTGQAWNMTFSYYRSLRAVPNDLREVAAVYRFSWLRTLRRVELPFATMGLVWNSMMSMAGGWFFLMINEAFTLKDRDFRLPGLGSYMSEAARQGRVLPQFYAVVAMVIMIVLLDQFLWRPVIVWAQKFRIEESASAAPGATSWFLVFLRHSGIIRFLSLRFAALRGRFRTAEPIPMATSLPAAPLQPVTEPATRPAGTLLSLSSLALLVAGLGYGAFLLIRLLLQVPGASWITSVEAGCVTLARVLLATAVGTLWALPAGIAIGLSPRISRLLQPVIQVVASFPAPMLFPAVIALLAFFGVGLGWGSILLMLLGTQWYILFNVVAGAMAIPADLREAARSYNLTLWQRFTTLYSPAVFPYLVTGWVTAAGGAWNASIVSEYYALRKNGPPLTTWGLGSQISIAASTDEFALLAASVIVMSGIVVGFNLIVWRRFYHLAETRYSLNK